MAISAKFVADFSDLSAKVRQAEKDLTVLSTGAVKVGTSFNRMITSFSGEKIVAEANRTIAVVEALGGSSKLTAAELQKVGAIASEAAEKLRAMGQAVPLGLQQIADEAANAAKQTDSLTQSFSATVAAFSLGQVIGDVIVGITKTVLDLAAALPQIALKGAAVDDVATNFDHLAHQAGTTAEALTGALRTGTHSTISDFNLMQVASRDLAAGMNLTDEQFGLLAKGAFALAQATGTDVKQALDTMNDAMLTGRTRALALLTGKIDTAAAEEKYAKSLGVTKDALTEAGKLEAGRAAILDAVSAATTRLGDQTDGLDERVAQAEASWSNFTDNLGRGIATSGVLMDALTGVKTILEQAFGGTQETLIQHIVAAVEDVVIVLAKMLPIATNVAGGIGQAFHATAIVFDTLENGLLHVDSAALRVQLAMVKMQAITDPFGPWKQAASDIERQIGEVQAGIADNQKAIQDHEKAEAAWAATTATTADQFDALIRQLQATRTSATEFVGPINQVQASQAALTQTTKEAEAAQRAYQKALDDYNAHGRTAQATVEALNQDMVEGIRYDLQRGISAETLTQVYKTQKANIEAIITVDKEEQAALKDTISNIEDFRRTGEQGAAAVVAGLKGMPFVLRDISVQMGDVQLAADKMFTGIGPTMRDGSIEAKRHIQEIEDAVVTLGDHLKQTFEAIPGILQAAFEGGGDLGGALKSIAVKLGTDFGRALSENINAAMSKVGTVLTGTTTALGGATGAAAGLGAAMSGASAKAAAASAALAGVSVAAGALAGGAAIGGAVALGAATAGIGIAAVGAYYGLKALFSSTEKEINPLRQAFVDAAGGLDALNQHAHTVGLTLDKLLNAKNAQQYNAAIQELNDAFQKFDQNSKDANDSLKGLIDVIAKTGDKIPDSLQKGIQSLIDMKLVSGDVGAALAGLMGNQETDFKKMQDLADKYGISLEALGQSFQAARLHDAATTIINDFDTLTRNGADVDGVLAGMKDEISKLVNDSIKFGVDIPENMKPWIEQLIKTGQLLDDNGNAVTDISQLKFSAPIVSEFDKIVQKLQELIDKITGTSTSSLTGSILTVPRMSRTMADSVHGDTERMINDFSQVEDAVDHVTYGRSPSGITGAILKARELADMSKDMRVKIVDQFKMVEDSVDSVSAGLDELLRKMASVPGVTLGPTESEGPFAGYPTAPTLIPEAEAVARIQEVAMHYGGRRLTDAEIRAIGQRYGYNGSGYVNKDRLESFLQDLVRQYLEGQFTGFAAGGIVYAARGKLLPFPARGTDTVPAMLTPGERVLSVKETQAYNAGLAAGGAGLTDGRLTALHQEVAGLRRDLAQRDREAPRDLARSLRDVLQKAI